MSRRSAQGQSWPSLKMFFADLGRLVAKPVRLGKEIGVDQAQEVGELVLVAVVRRRRQQEQMVGLPGEPRGEFVALGRVDLGVAADAARGRAGGALVGLVDDDEVPPLLPDTLAHVVLLGVVERGDDLGVSLPGVDELLLVDGGEDDVERLAEPAEQFVLPLDRQRGRAEDQDAIDGLAELHLLDQQPRHDRLARAGVVGQQESQTRLRQHPLVDGLDLVRQRADARQADGELPVVHVGQANPSRLDQETETIGIDRSRGSGPRRSDPGEGLSFFDRDYRLVESAVGEPHPAFVAQRAVAPQSAYFFEENRYIEMPREGDSLADRE